MKFIALTGCTLTVPGGTVTVTGGDMSTTITIDNKQPYHSIDFTIKLESGHIGKGTINGSSVNAFGDNKPFVLEGDKTMVEASVPPPSTVPPTTVPVTVSLAGNTSVQCD